MSEPKDGDGLKQLSTFVPKNVDEKLAEKAKAEGKTKREAAALSAYVRAQNQAEVNDP